MGGRREAAAVREAWMRSASMSAMAAIVSTMGTALSKVEDRMLLVRRSEDRQDEVDRRTEGRRKGRVGPWPRAHRPSRRTWQCSAAGRWSQGA